MAEERITFDEPHERLTAIASLALDAIESQVEREELRVVIVIVDATSDPTRSGIGIKGYENPGLVFADLFQQLKAIGATMGTEVKIAPLGRG